MAEAFFIQIFFVSGCLRRLCSTEGTWDTLEGWVIYLGHSTGLTMGVNVENWTCLWGVTDTSSCSCSARISSSMSPLSVGKLPRSGTWPTLSMAPPTVLTVPGSTSSASPLSWAKLWVGKLVETAAQEMILIWPDVWPLNCWASSVPSPALPPSPLLGAAFVREQPLVPCGPAPLQ